MAIGLAMDGAEVRALLGALPRRLATGTARAINRTVTATRAFMATQLADTTGIPALVVGSRLATVRAFPDRLEGEVNARTRGASRLIPILQMRARQVGRGPSLPGGVAFRFAGEMKTIPNAFIATMRGSGHRGVFSRVGRSRLPIIEEKGPAMRTVFEMHAERGRAFAQREFEAQLARELDEAVRVA